MLEWEKRAFGQQQIVRFGTGADIAEAQKRRWQKFRERLPRQTDRRAPRSRRARRYATNSLKISGTNFGTRKPDSSARCKRLLPCARPQADGNRLGLDGRP